MERAFRKIQSVANGGAYGKMGGRGVQGQIGGGTGERILQLWEVRAQRS